MEKKVIEHRIITVKNDYLKSKLGLAYRSQASEIKVKKGHKWAMIGFFCMLVVFFLALDDVLMI